MKIINKLFYYLIRFYQKYLTILSFGSCRYHPTCSSYALMQFEHNNIFVAFYRSIFRILRCNPLSDGGFDYPTCKANFTKGEFKRIRVKYWFVPKDKNNYYILQNWKKNNQDKSSNVNEQPK